MPSPPPATTTTVANWNRNSWTSPSRCTGLCSASCCMRQSASQGCKCLCSWIGGVGPDRVHLTIHPSTHPLIYPLIHPLFLSYPYLPIHPLPTHPLIYPFIHLLPTHPPSSRLAGRKATASDVMHYEALLTQHFLGTSSYSHTTYSHIYIPYPIPSSSHNSPPTYIPPTSYKLFRRKPEGEAYGPRPTP